VIELVQLLTSELVTNAAVHARSPLELVLDHRAAAVRVEVYDRDTTIPTDAEKGRGLVLVDALADRWGANGTTTGKVVWFEIADPKLEPPPGPAPPNRPDRIGGIADAIRSGKSSTG
jgi:anti-sigma regulatory factor (Ser/Thr protein kinase)